MKKLFTLLTMLFLGIGSMWGDPLLPTAVVGTTAFQATALTTGVSGHTITKDGSGNVTISPNNGGYFGNNSGAFTGTLVIKINVPETPKSGFVCEFRSASGTTSDGSQGLYLSEGRVLATSWTGNVRGDGNMNKNSSERTLTSGEHTIIFIAGNNGGYVIVDSTDGIYFSDSGLKRSNIEYKVIEISADYAPYITEVHYFSDSKSDTDKTIIFSECSNHMHASQQAGTTASVASGKTLILDKAVNWTSLTGAGTVLQEVNIATTVAGDLPALTLKATAGTLNYTGNNLAGTTLDGVVLASTTARVTTSGTVNIKNLAGCNLPNPSGNYGYAFIGSGTINFYGTCDLTKKSDGTTDALSSNLGYGSSATIVVKENATLKAGVIFNTRQSEDNASITVESGGTLTTIGWTHDDGVIYATNLVNNGIINISTGRYTSGYGISTIHNTLSGSGTLNIAEGSNFNVASIPGTSTLTGAGNVILTSTPTSTAPTLSDWTGTVQFPDNISVTNITDIFNAWGNANSTINLNNLSGYFSNTTAPVQPTLNILENKTLTITNGFSDNPPVLSKLTGKGNINLSWTGWRDNFNLTIQKLTGFEGTLTTATAPINVEKLYLSAAPDADALLIKTSGAVTLNKLYVGLVETTAYTWEKKTDVAEPGIYVKTYDIVQLYRDMAIDAVTPYLGLIGTGVGKYTIYLLDKESQKYIEYYTTADFVEAINAWEEQDECSIPTVTINQPTSGFYRFHIGVNYMCSDEDNNHVRTATTTNDDASTIFYLDANNYLIAYSDGYGFNYGYCRAITPGIFNVFDFSESTLLTKYNIHSNAGTGDSEWSDRNITINTSDNKLAEGQGTWAIETVTSLPVTLKASALGYATFCCPVPVKIPSGVSAYVSKINGTKIKLYQIHHDNLKDGEYYVIPANTPVLLHVDGGLDPAGDDYEASFVISDYDGEGISGDDFYGTIAAEAMGSGTYYSLRAWTASNDTYPSKVGFYTKSGDLAGFKAWIHDDSSSARNFTIVFDGDEDPTGIVEALGLENDNVEIYDLNGRKLSSYKKGINIVNGKKLMVK